MSYIDTNMNAYGLVIGGRAMHGYNYMKEHLDSEQFEFPDTVSYVGFRIFLKQLGYGVAVVYYDRYPVLKMIEMKDVNDQTGAIIDSISFPKTNSDKEAVEVLNKLVNSK